MKTENYKQLVLLNKYTSHLQHQRIQFLSEVNTASALWPKP